MKCNCQGAAYSASAARNALEWDFQCMGCGAQWREPMHPASIMPPLSASEFAEQLEAFNRWRSGGAQ